MEPAPQVIGTTDRWLAIAKPAGWLTIPGRAPQGAQTGAPTSRVLSEWVEREHGPAWVVHRLDRETSGVILFARSAEAHREASLWFQNHQVRKAYDFLAVGELRAPLVKLREPIEGAASTTQVESRERFEGCFLGRAVPLTGRRHQIRIHLAREGHPLLGDSRYDGPAELPAWRGGLRIERVALHAARLELPSHEVFEAAWPADLAGWVERLRARRES